MCGRIQPRNSSNPNPLPDRCKMTLTITINMDNAAFDNPSVELCRIFDGYIDSIVTADSVSDLPDEKKLRDSNGNTVGKAVVSE